MDINFSDKDFCHNFLTSWDFLGNIATITTSQKQYWHKDRIPWYTVHNNLRSNIQQRQDRDRIPIDVGGGGGWRFVENDLDIHNFLRIWNTSATVTMKPEAIMTWQRISVKCHK